MRGSWPDNMKKRKCYDCKTETVLAEYDKEHYGEFCTKCKKFLVIKHNMLLKYEA